jgi:hypothetical protein
VDISFFLEPFLVLLVLLGMLLQILHIIITVALPLGYTDAARCLLAIKGLGELLIGRLDLMLLELLYEIGFLFAHLLGQVHLFLIQLIVERLLDVLGGATSTGHHGLHA